MAIERIRRLAAVWFADISGYTSLSAHDEESAFAVVAELQRIARTEVEIRGGHIVKFIGDAVLACFDGAESAVRSALAVRDGFETSEPVQKAGVRLRIGLHVGEISESVDGDVYGDGVNIASRLQTAAEPGQILISEVVQLQIRQRPTFQVDALGDRALKGVEGVIPVFSVRLGDEAEIASVTDLLQEAVKPIQIVRPLATGGMGEIYLGRDPVLRRTLAIKVLQRHLARDPTGRARFFREAEAIAGIAHPNVLGVHSVGELPDGTPYFVMDYVAGESLAERLAQRGPFNVRDTRRIVGQVASALAAAHSRGVVHRDIKPSNVLLDEENGRALVSDFGVAAFNTTGAPGTDARLTQAGTIIGSPEFMSPEQFLGETVSPTADVYALGILAYQLLLARGPFEATSPQRLMVAHVNEQPVPLRTLRPDVDPEFDVLIQRCLRKDPGQRPNAEDIARFLSPGAEAVLEWPPPGLDELHGRGVPVATLFGSGFALLLAPLFVTALSHLWRAPHGQSVWILILTLGIAAGSFQLARALRAIHSLTRAVRSAWHLGYSSGTIVEVLADSDRDTGKLTAGLREYATLEPGSRGKFRKQRVATFALIVLSAGLTPVAGIIAIIFMSAGFVAPSIVAGTTLMVLLAPLVIAARLRRTENLALREPRLQLHQAARLETAVRELVPPWYDAFDRTARGDGPGRGGRVPPWLSPALRVGAAMAIVTVVFVTVVFAIVGQLATDPSFHQYGRTQARAESLRRFRDLRLPTDSSITPAAARQALLQIGELPNQGVWMAGSPTEQSVLNSPIVGPSPLEVPYSLSILALIPAAFRGLTGAERDYLKGFVADPAFPLLELVAHAPHYQSITPGTIDSSTFVLDIPIPRFGKTREAAYRKFAQAALAVADRDYAAAERILRENVSVGIVMTNDATLLIEALIGAIIGNLGLEGLAQLYEGLGRESEAQDIRAALAAASPPDGGDDNVPEEVVPSRAQLLDQHVRILGDTTLVRAVRWASLDAVVLASSCQDLRGLLLGPSPKVRVALKEARTLARTADEELLYVAIVQQTDRIYNRPDEDSYPFRQTLGLRAITAATRAAGALVRNSRLTACWLVAPAYR